MEAEAYHFVASDLKWRAKTLSLAQLCGHRSAEDDMLVAFLNESQLGSPAADVLKQLCTTFAIPSCYWMRMSQDASGFFQAARHRSKDNRDLGYTTTFRFLIKRKTAPNRPVPTSPAYNWDKFGFAMCWRPQGGLTVLGFSIPERVRYDIAQSLLSEAAVHYGAGPYSLHAMLVNHVTSSFDSAVWSWRDVVRKIEKTRMDDRAGSLHGFEHMHETARHVIHSSEMLSTALSVIENMCLELNSSPLGTDDPHTAAILRELHFCQSLITSFLLRSQALEKRLQNEINLAIHLNAQHSGLLTGRIAELAQRDSEITKGISILGMLFLPGTFVSAIFSMSFFDSTADASGQSSRLTLTGDFWMYWATAIPLTAVTLALWYTWHHGFVFSRQSRKRAVQREQGFGFGD